MFDKSELSKKLLHLRTNHNLSLAQEATLLGITRAPLNQFENEKALPQFSTLLRIADLYAVSTDWLFGRVIHPYNEKLSFKLEQQLLTGTLWFNYLQPAKNEFSFYNLLLDNLYEKCHSSYTEQYKNPKNRHYSYSPVACADIIFCLNIVKHFSKMLVANNTPEITDSDLDKAWGLYADALSQKESTRVVNAWLKLAKYCYTILEGYLVADSSGNTQLLQNTKFGCFSPSHDNYGQPKSTL